jgi:quinol monooxygenase YgiN
MSNDFPVLIRMKAKTGQEDAVKQELLTQLVQTRSAAGCINADLYRSTTDMLLNAPDTSRFVLQVKWRDPAAMRAYMAGMSNSPEEMAHKAAMFDGRLEVTGMISPHPESALDVSDKVKSILWLKAKADLAETIKQGAVSKSGAIRQDLYQGLPGAYDPSVFVVDQIWADRESIRKAESSFRANPPFNLDALAEPRHLVIVEMISKPVWA